MNAQPHPGQERLMAINATWHRKHLMPKNATAAQRLKWHEAHARHCGCRPFTSAMRTKLRREIAAKSPASRTASK